MIDTGWVSGRFAAWSAASGAANDGTKDRPRRRSEEKRDARRGVTRDDSGWVKVMIYLTDRRRILEHRQDLRQEMDPF